MNTELGGNKEQKFDLGITSEKNNNPEHSTNGIICNDQLLANKNKNST